MIAGKNNETGLFCNITSSLYNLSGIPEFLDSVCKCWTLDSGRWTLDAGLWTLDAGLWTLNCGCWALDAGHYT